MTRPMPEPPKKYQLLGPMVIVWEGGNGYYYHPSLMDAKRLTDAECAAEYWRAEAEVLYFDPDVDHLAWSQAVSRQEIINRFASRPHALEVQE